MIKKNIFYYILFINLITVNPVYADADKIELYKGHEFALGVGAAIVKFDTKMKFTDKQSGDSIFLDPEGNLDLPEISHVTAIYGGYNFNSKHSIGISFFSVNRESSVFSFDKTFEDVRVVGDATMSDTTNFYQLNYGYTLFNDDRSKIKLIAGIYSLDLKYVFKAEGDITVGGVTTSGSILEEVNVFAPLPLIGLDFWFSFTPEWSMATKVGFVSGSYEDLSAVVFQTGINAQYKFTKNIGGVIGLTSFSADVVIEDNVEKQDISYAYDGLFIGMHFVF
ncbi:MAG: hypothetical protein KAT12_05945 [Gammaproteobacteria bacterium]|nr:hypothetical protein [Gammaproteobacteria bacterium]